jgi:hypothetical protein
MTQPVRSSHARNSHMTDRAVLDLGIMDLPVVWMFALYWFFKHLPAEVSGRTDPSWEDVVEVPGSGRRPN